MLVLIIIYISNVIFTGKSICRVEHGEVLLLCSRRHHTLDSAGIFRRRKNTLAYWGKTCKTLFTGSVNVLCWYSSFLQSAVLCLLSFKKGSMSNCQASFCLKTTRQIVVKLVKIVHRRTRFQNLGLILIRF